MSSAILFLIKTSRSSIELVGYSEEPREKYSYFSEELSEGSEISFIFLDELSRTRGIEGIISSSLIML